MPRSTAALPQMPVIPVAPTTRPRRAVVLALVSLLALVATCLVSVSTAPAAEAATRHRSKAGPASKWKFDRPDRYNTGVPKKMRGKLKKHVGDIVIDKPGTVINGLDIFGSITVRASNVTIKNSRVRGGRPDYSRGLIQTYGNSNVRIQHVYIKPDHRSVLFDGIRGSGFKAYKVSIEGTVDSIAIADDNVRVARSSLRKTAHFASDPSQGGGPSHDDNVQIWNGDNVQIIGNSITGSKNFAVLAAPEMGSVRNLRVHENWLNNGYCTVKFSDYGGANPIDVRMFNNRFGNNRKVRECTMVVTDNLKNFREHNNRQMKTNKLIWYLRDAT